MLFENECLDIINAMDIYEHAFKNGKSEKELKQLKKDLIKIKNKSIETISDTINIMVDHIMSQILKQRLNVKYILPYSYRCPKYKKHIIPGSRVIHDGEIHVVVDFDFLSRPRRGMSTPTTSYTLLSKTSIVKVSDYHIRLMSNKQRKEYALKNIYLNDFAKRVKTHIQFSPDTIFGKQFCKEGQRRLDQFKIKF